MPADTHALTELELTTLRRFADVLTEGGYCGDPSPFHGDLVQRAAEEIARLREQVQIEQTMRMASDGYKSIVKDTVDLSALKLFKARVAKLEAALRILRVVYREQVDRACAQAGATLTLEAK